MKTIELDGIPYTVDVNAAKELGLIKPIIRYERGTNFMIDQDLYVLTIFNKKANLINIRTGIQWTSVPTVVDSDLYVTVIEMDFLCPYKDYKKVDYDLTIFSDIQPFVSPHYFRGGTGITNFSKKSLPIYQKAVAIYNKNLRISSLPIEGHYGYYGTEGMMSLHYIKSPEKHDISDFWAIFNAFKNRD